MEVDYHDEPCFQQTLITHIPMKDNYMETITSNPRRRQLGSQLEQFAKRE